MLHILWMILKFILILLAVILGLVVLMLLLLLFCPVRYRLHAEKTEEQALLETSGEAKISWLFGGIAVKVLYHDKKPDFSVFLFGFSLDRLLKRKKDSGSGPEENGPAEPVQDESIREDSESVPVPVSADDTGTVTEQDIAEDTDAVIVQDSAEDIGTVTEREDADESGTVAEPDNAENTGTAIVQDSVEDEKTAAEIPEVPPEEENPSVFRKIGGILSGIADKIRAVRDKIRGIFTKISWWKEFIFHERTQAAIHLMLQNTGRIIRHFLPTKMSGHMSFGFEDPSITGRIVAFLGMTIPFHKNCIAAQPSFECRSFAEGDVTIKGRIYFIVIGMCIVRLLLSKDIRFVLKKWKRRDKEEQNGT